MRKWHRDIFYSFPLQLVVLHLRNHLFLLGIWLFLAAMISGHLGQRLGLPYLFLDPEYLDKVNFYSFYFLGLAYGSFFMSWNLTTYLLTAHYFPFLASLSRPFTKFCINNAVIPLVFFLFYLITMIRFQAHFEHLPASVILLNVLGLICGALTIILLYSFYFHFTNKDISHYHKKKRPVLPPNLDPAIAPGSRKVDLDYIKQDRNRWRVATYLTEACRPRIVRSVAHYDSKLLMNIFRQNHLNALLMQLITMILLLSLGYLIDYKPFLIPAGASVFIMLSVFVAVAGAIAYWFTGWRVTMMVVILLAVNFFTRFDTFKHPNRAYGMDYEADPAPYTYESLQSICFSDQVEKDKRATVSILENWKRRVTTQPGEKPRMVILCASGGGLKAAVWTMKVAQTADSLTGGKLLDHTVLITGASGGMIGMSYLRELYRQKQLGEQIDLYDPAYINHISRDLLNSIAFTIVSNDFFLPWSTFEYNDEQYHKDRAYIYEKQLNENTGNLLDKPLKAYREPEAEGSIPMLFLTPSVVNDGRRLIISPQGVSYMMIPPVGMIRHNSVEVDAVDFGWLFAGNGAQNLRFLTALRMNSTYPYVLPNVHLPSRPEVEVMDAGFLDNYGITSATRFIQVFKDWIRENTSGVVLMQICSSEKIEKINPSGKKGIIESLFNPIGIAGKVLVLQEFEHDNSLGFIYDLLGTENFEVLRFLYHPGEENKIQASVSFHITKQEKENVLDAIEMPDNQGNLQKLQSILGLGGRSQSSGN
ncbi:MAG: patatin-like phospholipase family protein [Lewinella sp.]|nr:patatin-like phospholipase family protein [Lewinella sp.]